MHFGPVAVEGSDPFGIFYSIKWLPVASECLVLPSWVRMTGMPSIPARMGAREQEQLVSKEGHSHEFLGIRPWTDGDSLKGVHWGLTARHGTLIVRQFQKEVEEELLIILDADRDGDIGEGAENAFEYLITLSLSLINSAIEIARPWNFILVSKKITSFSYRMKDSLRQAQYGLAELRAERDQPIEDLLDSIRADYPNTACILLTARMDSNVAASLSKGDMMIGGGMRSVLIRVDPSGFVSSVSSGVKSIKYKRFKREVPVIQVSSGMSKVTEIMINKGDNLAELFAGVRFA
jgi:uncharacterized protein (DUF58 family)